MIRRLFENKNRLFYKMFVLVSLSVFVPVVLLGLLSYEKSKNQLTSVTSQFLEDNLRLNARQINTFLHNVELESEKTVASRELQVLLGAKPPADYRQESDFINRMIEIISHRKGFNELYVFPKDIDRYPHYRKLIRLNKIEPTPELFRQVFEKQGKGLWFNVWDDNLQQPTFVYVRAIRSSYYYEPLGMLAIQIPETAVREMMAPPSSFPNYLFLMMDSRNNIISYPNSSKYNEQFFSNAGWSKAEIGLDVEGWKLVAAVPQKDMTGTIDQIKNSTFWIVLASLVVITIFLVLIVRSFTIPFKQLVLHMNKVRMGVLSQFAPNQTNKDEIGQLVRGYNQMISGMSELLATTKEMEADKRQLELQSLNHQINPHFFYNTLDAIKWRAEKAGEGDIAAMVMKLANLLRFSLNNGDEWTTVEREIEHARTYLDIEQLRSRQSFQVFFQADPDLLKCKVIKLILQPIVENAVKHGVKQLPEGKGKIRITAKRRDNDIVFVIEDNGPGLVSDDPEANTTSRREEPHGIGLGNVNKRLELHFGFPYGIEIDYDRPSGVLVTVRHPLLAHVMA